MEEHKSFMDCPPEVQTMILRGCTQGTMLALMRVNKYLLHTAGQVFYAQLHLTEKNVYQFLGSRYPRSPSKTSTALSAGGEFGKRSMVVQKVSLECGWRESKGGNYVITSDDIISLLDTNPHHQQLFDVESLFLRVGSHTTSEDWIALLRLSSRVQARHFCDATGTYFYYSDAYSHDEGEFSREKLDLQEHQNPTTLTMHNFESAEGLWILPSKEIRLCVDYEFFFMSPAPKADIIVNVILDRAKGWVVSTIKDVERKREGDEPLLRWTIYMSDLKLFRALVIPTFDDGLSEDEVNESFERVDRRVAREIFNAIVKECPGVEDRVQVFTCTETAGKHCEGCGRSMDYAQWEE